MAHKIQVFLGLERMPLFSDGILKLEKSTGMSGVDTKLIADIISRSHEVMRKLGLAPHDTIGLELYHALATAVDNGSAKALLADTEYVLVLTDAGLISMNYVDVVENANRNLKINKRVISQAQKSLRKEVINRYMTHSQANKKLIQELASDMGLLPDSDAWYNNPNYKHNYVAKSKRSGA